MRENKTYSVRKQPASKPHKVGTKSDVPVVLPKDTESTAQPVASAPKPVPPAQVSSPVSIPAPVPQPPVQQTVTPAVPMQPSPVQGQQEAIALARSKIANIYGYSYGQEGGAAEPGQSPVIAAGYAAQQQLQEVIDPKHKHHAQPDHQLPGEEAVFDQKPPVATGYRKQYETFTMPGQQPSDSAPTAPQMREAPPVKKATPKKSKGKSATIKNLRKKIQAKKKADSDEKTPKGIHRFRRFIPAGIVVTIAVLIMNNQLVYGQISYYVTPGSRVETPTIVESSVDNIAPPEPKVIIPKINVDVPVNYTVDSYSEEAIQAGLEDGVVHYANTGLPGQVGNNVIFGHSTNNFWNSGKYKTAFVLLDRMEKGDTFEIHFESKRYIYEIYEKKVVNPDDFSIITQQVTEPIVTLVTCTPPGTSWQRLVLQARQISPKPQAAAEPTGNELPDGLEGDVPSDSESPLESIFGWLW